MARARPRPWRPGCLCRGPSPRQKRRHAGRAFVKHPKQGRESCRGFLRGSDAVTADSLKKGSTSNSTKPLYRLHRSSPYRAWLCDPPQKAVSGFNAKARRSVIGNLDEGDGRQTLLRDWGEIFHRIAAGSRQRFPIGYPTTGQPGRGQARGRRIMRLRAASPRRWLEAGGV